VKGPELNAAAKILKQNLKLFAADGFVKPYPLPLKEGEFRRKEKQGGERGGARGCQASPI
jgi:hypothetical protein